MTGTPIPPIPPSAGIEHTLTPGFELLWAPIDIGWDICVPLIGYIITTRYRTWILDPITNTYLPVYQQWELVSQELTCISHTNPFQQPEPLFVSDPGVYISAVSGIVDGSCYDYFKVFDRSDVAYLEANGPYDSVPIKNETIPDPIDALTKFKPDTRESVIVTYELKTEYNIGIGLTAIYTSIITQSVHQSTNNWSAQVKGYVKDALFTLGNRPIK